MPKQLNTVDSTAPRKDTSPGGGSAPRRAGFQSDRGAALRSPQPPAVVSGRSVRPVTAWIASARPSGLLCPSGSATSRATAPPASYPSAY